MGAALEAKDVSAHVCYAPPLLPDELIYSWLARLAAYNALWDPKTYVELLFGNKDVIPSVDLPTRLQLLHDRLGPFSPCTATDDIIETATIFPYHRPFLTCERGAAVRLILLGGGGKGLKTLMGRVANRFGANPALRYCPTCAEEDIARHGLPYWRRSHQLPGVTCCAMHRLDLIVYAWPSSLTDRQRLILPPNNRAQPASRCTAETQQVWFSALSRDLLEAGLQELDPLRRRAAYEAAATALGFRTRRDRIDFDALASAVRRHYKDFEGFMHRERLMSTPVHPLGWLRDLFDRPSRSSHPICHLVLIGFLFGSITEFIRSMHQTSRPGIGGNGRLTQGGKTPLVHDTSVPQNLLLQDVSLSCRTVARTLGLSVTTIVSRRRALGVPIAERHKYLTPGRLQAVTKALAKGLLPSSIARRYRVSVATVYRVRAQSPELLQVHVHFHNERDRLKRRGIWQRAVAKHPNAGLRTVRSASPATYTWLFRHDRAWLQQIDKTLPRPHKAVRRVDWTARDTKLCRQLETFIDALKHRADRPRLSKTLMLRHLGDAMVRANLTRLPHLRGELEKYVESPLAFQSFRIERAIAKLAAQGQPIQLWRVQRAAGIRKWTRALRVRANRIATRVTDKPSSR